MAVQVNIHEAKTHLSRLVEQVAAGEEVVISRAGKPVVDLIPHQSVQLVFGALKDEISYDDATFDELDDDIQRIFYGDDAAR